jgi:hypothetical protein
MHWLFEIIRTWVSARFNRDPKILPVKARGFTALTFFVIVLIYIYAPKFIGFPRTLAACGVVLGGVFGAGVLYWETVATPQDLQSVRNETTAGAANRHLSLTEKIEVISFAILGLVMFSSTSAVVVLSAMHNPNQVRLYTALRVMVVFIAYVVVPALGMYVFAKWQRRFCSRWAERFRLSQDPTAETKRFLRLVGFACWFWGGLLQLPALFV